MAKRSGLKIVLIIVGVVAALGLLGTGLCVLSGYLWFQNNAPALREAGQRGQSDALAFAAGHTQSECIDEGFRHHDACGTELALTCRAETRIFVDQCLRQASPTPGLCEGVPAPTAIMEGATWAVQYCRDHGRPNDQQCANFVRAIVEYCGRP